jgi:hypothetical protein
VMYVYRNANNGEVIRSSNRLRHLDRFDNWSCDIEDAMPASPGSDAPVMPAAWSDPPDPAHVAPPQPDPIGAQLVVVTRSGRRRKGAPPANVAGTDLDPGK